MASKDLTETSIYLECLELFLQHGGRNILAIEREMRARGHAFQRRSLYKRGKTLGWIAKYHWRDLLPGNSIAAGNAGGLARTSPQGEQIHRDEQDEKDKEMSGGDPICREAVEESGSRNAESGGKTAALPDLSSHPSPSSLLDFRSWLRTVSPNMKWLWRHQQHICEQLERFTRGEIKRLMLFLPPRHGKSELVTVRYAAWRIKRDPSMNVIVAGYGQRLANRFSRKIRNVLADAAPTPGNAGDPACMSPQGEQIHRDKQDKDDKEKFIENHRGGAEAPGSDPSTGNVQPSQPCNSSSSSPSPSSPFKASCPCCSSRHARRINSVAEWETHAGGGFRAVGVGGAVTGFGANLIIIDDPIKNRQQAESQTYRDRTWEWFNDDISTRLEPDGGIILIQTRWHEDDLAGRLLRDMEDGGEPWEVISLPAIAETQVEKKMDQIEGAAGNAGEPACMSPQGEQIHRDKEDEMDRLDGAFHSRPTETQSKDQQNADSLISSSHPSPSSLINSADWREPGEALCPERFNEEALEKLRRQLGTYSYSALYQQSPTPRDGGLFKRHWFSRIVPEPPRGLRWARGYDLAVSTNADADYTASFRCAYGKDGTLYIDGGFRARIEYPDQRRYLLSRLADEPDTQHGIETALHGQAFIQDLRREPGSRGRLLKGVKVGADKITRALTWSPLAEEGKVALVRGTWNTEFIDEAASFPHGAHDDQIDAVSVAVQLLAQRSGEAFGF